MQPQCTLSPLPSKAACAPDSDASSQQPGWLQTKADRYALQSVAREWLPDHGVVNCHRRPARRDLPVEVWHSPGRDGREGRACFGALQTCQSPWADPVCAGAISDYRRKELRHGLGVHRGAGGSVHLVTYTARHNERTGLSAILRALLRAVRAMRKRRDFIALRRLHGHVGSVRATEVTLGNNGWHPHFHELWFGDASDAGVGLADELRRRWMAALADQGLDGLPGVAADVREASMTVDDYVTKYGRDRTWDVDAELAKAIAKRGHGNSLMPFDLLRYGLIGQDAEVYQWARERYAEYVTATKGRSSMHWSPGLRDKLGIGEVTDGDISGGVDLVGAVLGCIGHGDWRRIIANDARLEVLAAAATGEWLSVQAVIDALPEGQRFNRMAAAASMATARATPAHRQQAYEAELRRMVG